jgi:uncharacterized protein YbjT (DUF2867 family)
MEVPTVSTILVTGARGNVAAHVIPELRKRGFAVRAMSRTIDPSALPDGVDAIRGDVYETDAVDAALKGVENLFLVVPPQGMLTITRNVVRGAREARVRHIVMMTSLSIEDADHLEMGRELSACEEQIIASGIAWTFLRPGDFTTNCYRWLPEIHATGRVLSGYGNYPTAPIDPADIAAVAVEALTQSGHEGAIHSLTGPEQITPEEQTQVIAALIGRPLRFEIATVEEAVAILQRLGVAEDRARDTVAGLRRPDLPWSVPRPTVEHVVGRRPGTFQRWAQDNVARLRAAPTSTVIDQ